MWWLYVLLAIIVLLYLILNIRLRFLVGYDEKPSVILKVLFFKLDILNRKKKKKSLEKKEQEEKEKKKKPKEEKTKDEKFISSPSDVIRLVREVALGLLKKFYGHLRVDSFRINVIVASNDPSKTAITYGAISPAVYSFVEALYKHKGKKSGEFSANVVPDFVATKSRFDIFIHLSMTIWQLLGCLISGGLGFAKYYADKKGEKEGTENGRNADEKND